MNDFQAIEDTIFWREFSNEFLASMKQFFGKLNAFHPQPSADVHKTDSVMEPSLKPRNSGFDPQNLRNSSASGSLACGPLSTTFSASSGFSWMSTAKPPLLINGIMAETRFPKPFSQQIL
jgi:hypothetical protein